VRSAQWDDRRARWTLELVSGEAVEADVVVSAIGMFNDLAWPAIPGLDSFAGASFHSARWRWDHDLSRQRVAVIGSAASVVQFVPEIVERAAGVTLFQRTANWVMPKLDTPYTAEQLATFRSDPHAAAALRSEIYRQVDTGMTFSDPEVLAKTEAAGLA